MTFLVFEETKSYYYTSDQIEKERMSVFILQKGVSLALFISDPSARSEVGGVPGAPATTSPAAILVTEYRDFKSEIAIFLDPIFF